MRRRFVVLAAAVPFVFTAVAHGCSDEPAFENICPWISSPENCFAEFHADLIATQGGPGNPDNPNGDCSTYTQGTPNPSQASANDAGTPNGTFGMRASLDTCLLFGGGAVQVNPPIDLTMFPMSLYTDPQTYSFTFINSDGTTCGMASYTSPHGFSLTVNPPAGTGLTTNGDAGFDAAGNEPEDAGQAFTDAAPFITSGTYTEVNPAGRDSMDVTCPSGESHHFTLDEVNLQDPAAGECPNVAALIPSASLQVFLGGIDVPGAVSFAISYPPLAPTFASDTSYAGVSETPNTVVYFNCQIPAQQETCMDGVKDGNETDIDCGGPQNPSKQFCGSCPARCATSQACRCTADCESGLVCGVDPSTGLLSCISPTEGVKEFTDCAWNPAEKINCPPGSMSGLGGGGGSSPASTSSSGSGAGGAPSSSSGSTSSSSSSG